MRDNPRVESYHFRHGSLLNFYGSQHHNTAQIPFSKASQQSLKVQRVYRDGFATI
jgi:hypothetical protein